MKCFLLEVKTLPFVNIKRRDSVKVEGKRSRPPGGGGVKAHALPPSVRKKCTRRGRPQETWPHQPLDPAHPPGEEGVERGWRAGGVGRGQRAWFDPPGPHVGQELVWDLRKHLLSQAGHAEDVVATAIDVVPERDKLQRDKEGKGACRGEEQEGRRSRKGGGAEKEVLRTEDM